MLPILVMKSPRITGFCPDVAALVAQAKAAVAYVALSITSGNLALKKESYRPCPPEMMPAR